MVLSSDTSHVEHYLDLKVYFTKYRTISDCFYYLFLNGNQFSPKIDLN